MKRFLLTMFAAMIVLFFVAQPAHACKILSAIIAGGEVKVIGIGAGKYKPIYWEGTKVTTSDKFGKFHFSTTDLPIDCVGELSNGVSTIEVVVFGCCTSEEVVGTGVPATGQTKTYATGDDGDLEKGVPLPQPRFTDNGNGTITDNLTELIWLKNADCFGQRTWSQALQDANGLAASSCGLNDGSVAGDWRLPNVRELQSLVDYGQFNPALPVGHPFTNLQASYYWSSTTDAGNAYSAGTAWGAFFDVGSVYIYGKTDDGFVTAVRGGP